MKNVLIVALLVWNIVGAGSLYAEESLSIQNNRLVKFTDRGLEPSTLQMELKESILFFLNETRDSLATIEIQFGNKTKHCASANLKIGQDGTIRSVRPYGPKDFASVCFHDPGTYDFTVYGLKSNPRGIKGRIVVSDSRGQETQVPSS